MEVFPFSTYSTIFLEEYQLILLSGYSYQTLQGYFIKDLKLSNYLKSFNIQDNGNPRS